jgi:hypothetical protein
MISKKLIAIVALTTMVGMIQTAQATYLSDLTTVGTVGGSIVGTANGGTLTIGDKIFSGFSFSESGLSGFNASQITVTASVGPGGVDFLTFGGNMQLAGVYSATGDLLLGYTVTATAGSIAMIDQRYTGGAVNGSILINETATGGAATAHSQLSVNDVSDPNTYPSGSFDIGENDLLSVIPPQTTLYVTKDLAFTILDGNTNINNGISEVSVSSVQQSFHQVPEPTTIIAGALLLLPFGASTLRILRKNRTA